MLHLLLKLMNPNELYNGVKVVRDGETWSLSYDTMLKFKTNNPLGKCGFHAMNH